MRKLLMLILCLFLASTLVMSVSCEKKEEAPPTPTEEVAPEEAPPAPTEEVAPLEEAPPAEEHH